jgi:ParB family transcriptional regulator, chromosome partitioning protein
MTAPLLSLPLAQIDAEALPRDRAAHNQTAADELWRSILRSGLRQPIEVFATPNGLAPYGLISGHRRLAAFGQLYHDHGFARFAQIPAFLRSPADIPAALAQMVEENDIRAELSAWERGRICLTARDAGHFPTLDAAVDGLYPHAKGAKRTRLRALATLAEELSGHLTAPETLSQNQALRLAAALRSGFADLIRHALGTARVKSADAQWAILQPILSEAEASLRDPTPYAPGRPRRLLHPRPGLSVRRERAPEGWLLRFTGPEATGILMETLMDEIERLVAPSQSVSH